MSEESKKCPFTSLGDWCTVFNETCIAIYGGTCKERDLIKKHYGSLEKQNEELEAENARLRDALKEIEDFAQNEYWKRIPDPSCPKFMAIKRSAEKALKGTGE